MKEKTFTQHLIASSVVAVLIIISALLYTRADPPAQPDTTTAGSQEWQVELEQYVEDASVAEAEKTEQEKAEALRVEAVQKEYTVWKQKYNGAINFIDQAMRAPEDIIAEPDTTAAADVWIPYTNEEFGFTMMRPAMSMVLRRVNEETGEVSIVVERAAYEARDGSVAFTVHRTSLKHTELLDQLKAWWDEGGAAELMNFIVENDVTEVRGEMTLRSIETATPIGLGIVRRIVEQEGKQSLLIVYQPHPYIEEMVDKVTLL